ncbi:MAG: PD40 domain-containing protein, partial [Acidobacteria bacterium]|nr:PD40 domain-containing protein [Candidatus Polarisedimenticola svalbardensis]
KPVDRRADIWSFGAVLYEMLTGNKAFAGETITDMIASVVKEDPDWSKLPADLSPSVVRTLQRCLAKKRRERFRDIGDVHWDLTHRDESDQQETALPIAGMFRSPWALITAVLALLLVGALMGRMFGTSGNGKTDTGSKQTFHVEIVLPDDAPVAIGSFLPAMTWIPDESGIVYVGLKDGTRRLYVRKLDDPVPAELPGTEGAEGPFVSPDSQWIGFYAEFALWKVPVAGGTPSVISPVRDYRGGAWGPGDRIVFADGQGVTLQQIDAAGGAITPLTAFQDDEWSHRFPSFLPDGDTVLYCAQAGPDFHYEKGHLRAYSISEDRTVKLEGTGCDAAYAEPGRLLYIQGGDLTAVPFDLERLTITGPPETMVRDVAIQINTGASQYAVSPAGNIAFAHGSSLGDVVDVTRIDRQGTRSSIAVLDGVHRTPRLSPDGRQLLITGIGENITGIWKLEVATGVHRRMALDAESYTWEPDGNRVIYATSDQTPGDQKLFRTAADFSGVPESLFHLPELRLTDAGRDGRLAMTVDGNIYTLPDGGSELEPFLETEAAETGLRFSPDGRFVTYVSDETGRYEVYVAEFPGPGGKRQISNDGGRQPIWSQDGSEIFFRSRRRLLAVPVRTSPSFEAGGQQELFLGPYEGVLGQQGIPNYDVAADRQSFIMLASPELQESQSRVGLLLRR